MGICDGEPFRVYSNCVSLINLVAFSATSGDMHLCHAFASVAYPF